MNRTTGETASRAFDALITVPTTATSTLDPAGLEPADRDQTDGGPSGPSPSFRTVVAAFLAIAIAQVGIVVIAPAIFDLDGVRTVLLGLVVGPAVLYGVIAAWDQRELVAAGDDSAPSWGWAMLPPVYLALRRRVRSASSGPRVALGWSLAQSMVIVAFAVFAVAIGVTAPAPAADAMATAAVPTTTEQVAEVVEQRWADAGTSGTAECQGPSELEPGDEVQCTGIYGGTPLVFAASVSEPDTGGSTVTIASWAAVPTP